MKKKRRKDRSNDKHYIEREREREGRERERERERERRDEMGKD